MKISNSRFELIVKELLSQNEPVTSEYLAQVIGVSSRTIRNDLNELIRELNKIGVFIESRRGVGYFIKQPLTNSTKELIEELFLVNENNNRVPILPEERVLYILKRIIMADAYTTIEQLANELYVSKSTVDNDLKQVEKLLKKQEITLIKKPNYGIKMVGDEMGIRFVLSECLATIREIKTNGNPGELDDFITDEKRDEIESIVKKHIEKLPLGMGEMPLDNLVMHIAIALERVNKGKYIEMDKSEFNRLEGEVEYQIARNIVSSLEEKYDITVPIDEIAYITIHLLGIKHFEEKKLTDDDYIELIGKEINQLVLRILSEINKNYRIDLRSDKELIYGLGLHLKSSINRMKYKMNLRNPMLQDIKNNYPFSFELGINAGKVIQKEIQL